VRLGTKPDGTDGVQGREQIGSPGRVGRRAYPRSGEEGPPDANSPSAISAEVLLTLQNGVMLTDDTDWMPEPCQDCAGASGRGEAWPASRRCPMAPNHATTAAKRPLPYRRVPAVDLSISMSERGRRTNSGRPGT